MTRTLKVTGEDIKESDLVVVYETENGEYQGYDLKTIITQLEVDLRQNLGDVPTSDLNTEELIINIDGINYVSDGSLGHAASEGDGIVNIVGGSGLLWKRANPYASATGTPSEIVSAFRKADLPFLAPPTDLQFSDVDLEAEKFADDTIVDIFNAPHPAAPAGPDPARDGLTQTADEYAYDSAVRPEFYIGAASDRYAAYSDDIQKFNALTKAMAWYSAQSFANGGKVVLRVKKGLHNVWGKAHQTGLLSGVSIAGDGVFISKINNVTFGASTRGATWSEATITMDVVPLSADVVVGMAYGGSDIMSADTDHTASSAAAIVNDDIAFLNGAHIITEIAPDRMSFKVDVPHARTSTVQLVGGPVLTTGSGSTGSGAGFIYIPLTQIAFTGGFDGRGDESWFRPQYGSQVTYEDLGFIDHTDPDIERENGTTPDRKNFFAANIAQVAFRDYCVLAGSTGPVLRIAKMVTATANRSHFGSAGLKTRGNTTGYGQLLCFMDFTRSSFSGAWTYGILGTAYTAITAQNCTIVNAYFGADAISGSGVNIQSSWIYGCVNGFYAATGGSISVDGSTVIENCQFAGNIQPQGELIKIGSAEMKIIGSGAVSDLRTQSSTFTTDIILNKVNGQFEINHSASAKGFIKNRSGQLHVLTDNAARDIHFGITSDDGATSDVVFQMDMSAKKLLIDGVAVIGELGAAVSKATAAVGALPSAPAPLSADPDTLSLQQFVTDLAPRLTEMTEAIANLKTTQDLIIDRMRAATPSIQT